MALAQGPVAVVATVAGLAPGLAPDLGRFSDVDDRNPAAVMEEATQSAMSLALEPLLQLERPFTTVFDPNRALDVIALAAYQVKTATCPPVVDAAAAAAESSDYVQRKG